MRLRTLREFAPVLVVPASSPSEFSEPGAKERLALTKEQCYELWYRVRRFQIDVSISAELYVGDAISGFDYQSFHFTFGTPPLSNHFLDWEQEPPIVAPRSEKDLVCLGARRGLEDLAYETDIRSHMVAGGSAFGDVKASIWTEFFFSSKIYRIGEMYYPQFYLELTLPTEIGDVVPSGGAFVSFSGGDHGAPGDVRLFTPWGHNIGGEVETFGMPPRNLSGSVTFAPVEWWAFAKADGTDPVVDPGTGLKLRDHRTKTGDLLEVEE